MIRVAIDAQIAEASRAGIGQFTSALVHWLPRVDAQAEYVPIRSKRKRDLSMPQRWWWDQVSVPRFVSRMKANVLLKTGFSAPVRSRAPTVIMLHDLAARLFPEHLHKPSAWFYGRWMPWTLRFAERVIAASEHTAAEAIRLLRIPQQRMRVVLQAGDPDASPQPQPHDGEIAKKLQLPARYILHVGTIEPRKNLVFLVRVFDQFRKRHPEYHLVLLGAEGWISHDLHEAVKERKLDRAVCFLGVVSDAERRTVYRFSRVLVLPSLYEGFGRAPLEAMASGVPVVAAANSSIPEVVGDAGLLILGFKEDEWLAGLEAAAEGEEQRRTLHDRGLKRSALFTWERASRQVAGILHEVVREPRSTFH